MAKAMLAQLQPQPPALSPRLTFWVSAAFVVFLYLCFVGVVPFADRVIYDLDETGGGDILKQIFFIILGLVFTVYLDVAKQTGGGTPLKSLISPLLLLTLGWALLSVGWSAVPEIALRRLILTVIVIFIAYAAVALLGPPKVLNLLFYTLVGLLFISVLAIPFITNAVHQVAERGADDLAGNWRGIFIHKNYAGFVCAFVVLVGLPRALYGQGSGRKWAWFGCGLACVFLWFSASKTSLILLPLTVAAGLLSARALANATPTMRRAYTYMLAVTVSLLGLGVWLTGALEMLSDPTAFTGRTSIWAVLSDLISQRPMLGYGFASLYGVGMATPLLNVASGWVLLAAYGHNGYLDMLASLGVIGLFLSVVTFVVAPLRQLIRLPNVPKDVLATTLGLLFFVVLHNITETSLFDRERPVWVVVLLVGAIVQVYAVNNNKSSA